MTPEQPVEERIPAAEPELEVPPPEPVTLEKEPEPILQLELPESLVHIQAEITESAAESAQEQEAAASVQAEPIEIGIGINTGPAMAGYLGTEERIEFTVLGDTVNVAQRLEAHARPNRVLIGPDTYLAVAGKFNTRSVGKVEVKGRTQPVDTHEVLRS